MKDATRVAILLFFALNMSTMIHGARDEMRLYKLEPHAHREHLVMLAVIAVFSAGGIILTLALLSLVQ